MKLFFISLFPDAISAYTEVGMMRKASEQGLASYIFVDLRQFGHGPRKQVDHTPYGGGDGMVLMVEPLAAAVRHCLEQSPDAKVILPTPRGEVFCQSDATGLCDEGRDLIFICSRYEGYDERITALVDEQISIGKFVLTGGELPAMIIADAVVRLIPDVLGGEQSVETESFADDASIEHPQYTKPRVFEGAEVPQVLLSGDHTKISEWREAQQM